jgi:hypothetical protein
MRRTKPSILPSVDAMETRLLPSTAGTLLSRHAELAVVREVKAIVNTLARTENTAKASTELTGLSSLIPSISTQLAVSWQSDLGFYRPHSNRSIIAVEKRIVADLYFYDEIGGGGSGPVSGSGTGSSTAPSQGSGGTSTPSPTPTPTPTPPPTSTPSPAPTLSLDSVRIENTTGLTLRVTIQLEVPQVQQPTITETISAQAGSIATFNFGSSTGDFMTMDVSAVGGGQNPPSWNNVNLSQPTSGYDGTTFTISLFGPYFSVNVP